ncbi:MAG: alpha/beta hydrolase [Lentisphaeria bacterium]|jgi:acetyl esterase/lipase
MKLSPQPLWPGRAPGAVGDQPEDRPTLTAFIPGRPTGAAMIVCPGGGYSVVVDHEKDPVAERLNALGITAFVLVYRVAPRYRHPAPLQDVARAVRSVRARAAEWNLDPARIGVIGFSAGGHLAAALAVHHDAGEAAAADPVERVSSRPDLAVLVYPVITMLPVAGHAGSTRNLLGENPKRELVEKLSLERQVTKDTPPAFLYHRRDDGTVPVQHPLLYANALAEAGVPFELHIYDCAGHGQVWAEHDPVDGDWPERLANWLRHRSF